MKVRSSAAGGVHRGPADLSGLAKLELHVHLEGTVGRSLLETIAARNGGPTGGADLDRVYRPGPGLDDFLRRFKTVCGLLQSPRDFRDLARGYGLELHRQNVRYAEVHLSLQVFTRRGLGRDAVLSAVHAGFEEVERTTGIRLRLILDGVRQWGPRAMRELLDLADGTRRWGVVGVGLGGDEASYPAAAFEDVYGAARDRGWKTTIHAGEVGGPEAVLEAVERLRVDRIEHGIRAAGDPGVLDRIAAAGIPLDFCPTSQRTTGAVPANGPYPLREFLSRDIPVTIGSDDPALFRTDLAAELRWVQAQCGLGVEEMVRLQRNGLRAAFLPPAESAVLEAHLRPLWRSWQDENRSRAVGD